jgi:hypothetical protein
MKSIIPALALALLLLATIGPAHAQWPLGRDAAQSASTRSEEPHSGITVNGRFQMFVSPHVKGHTFMLDTDTGRVWIMKKDHASGDFSLQRVPVEQVEDPKQPPAKDQGRSDTKKPTSEK